MPTKRVMTASARATVIGVIDRAWLIMWRLVELVRHVDVDLGDRGEDERLDDEQRERRQVRDSPPSNGQGRKEGTLELMPVARDFRSGNV